MDGWHKRLAMVAVGAMASGAALAAGPFGDWRDAAPGKVWTIKPADLPRPYATESASNTPSLIPWTEGTKPVAPAGFAVDLFAKGLSGPRKMAVAPNGDVF